jgi:diguanylate cyclase (GGDEF)-like protein
MATGGAARTRPASLSDANAARLPLDPRVILTSIGEVVYDWDIPSDAIAWGLNAAEVLGVSDVGLLACGQGFAQAVEPASGVGRHEAILHGSGSDGGLGVPYRTRYALRVGARVVAVEDTGRWYADGDGRPAFAHGVLRVERTPDGGSDAARRARNLFLDGIAAEVAALGRSKRSLTLGVVAIADLDRINDRLGCEGADALFDAVETRLRTVMRRRDTLARYAGNRFAVALLSCPAEQAALAARRLGASVENEPIPTALGPLPVRLCVGAATAPEHAADAPGLLRRAEEALAVARRGDGLPFRLYEPGSGEAVRRARGTAALDVVEALNGRRLLMARQPVVDARTRRIVFSEALVRLAMPGGRLAVAGDLLPAVERAGLVPLVDGRMLHLVTDHLAAHPDERLSLNVSPLTLETDDWLSTLAAHLGARPGIASRLIVEITETAAVRDPDATRARLDAMKALGVVVAIDDFGAGHTSFRHLRSFPVDLLKLDGAFVQNLSRSADDRFFVRTLIDLARHLDIPTVAEWVEDEETARLLTEWGIDYLQGDHCGAPAVTASAEDEALAGAA